MAADGWDVSDFSRSNGGDVRDGSKLRAAIARAKPDALVYSAGVVHPNLFINSGIDEWEEQIAVNLTGAMIASKAFLLSRVSHGGSIVLISSTAGTRPSPGWAGYAASKAALANFGLSIAAELAPNFRVYVLAPGRCATALRARLAPDEDPESIMQPSEVAEVVATCINDHNGVLAGKVIEVGRLQR